MILLNCKGVAHTYADHVDTDVIIPARTLNNPDPAALALHCMEDLDPTFVSRVRPGDLVVGGLNFGCGSSREHAPIALRACGISCVIAKSFARIFFRNAINIGLPVLTCPEAADGIHSGDQLHVVLETGLIHNLTTGESFTAAAFPPFMRELIAAGGLIGYTKAKLREGR